MYFYPRIVDNDISMNMMTEDWKFAMRVLQAQPLVGLQMSKPPKKSSGDRDFTTVNFPPAALIKALSSQLTVTRGIMNSSSTILRHLGRAATRTSTPAAATTSQTSSASAGLSRASQTCCRAPTTCRYSARRPFSSSRLRSDKQAGDSPEFVSIVDGPPQLVRASRRKHGPGLILLGTLSIFPTSSEMSSIVR